MFRLKTSFLFNRKGFLITQIVWFFRNQTFSHFNFIFSHENVFYLFKKIKLFSGEKKVKSWSRWTSSSTSSFVPIKITFCAKSPLAFIIAFFRPIGVTKGRSRGLAFPRMFIDTQRARAPSIVPSRAIKRNYSLISSKKKRQTVNDVKGRRQHESSIRCEQKQLRREFSHFRELHENSLTSPAHKAALYDS